MEDLFNARLAPTFETQPIGERLYEVVTPEGERIGSATSELAAGTLANELNTLLKRWSQRFGNDAVLG